MAKQVGASRDASAQFGERVRRARVRLGWDQSELAQRMTEVGQPMGQSRVAEIEAGGVRARTVTVDQAAAFARLLGEPLASLQLASLLVREPDDPDDPDIRAERLALARAERKATRACLDANERRWALVRLLRAKGIDAPDPKDLHLLESDD